MAEDERLDDAYLDRNLLALLLADIVSGAFEWPAGFAVDPNEPEWPVLLIEIQPEHGPVQVSYHLPASLLSDLGLDPAAHPYPGTWDGHTTEAKRAGIMGILRGPRSGSIDLAEVR